MLNHAVVSFYNLARVLHVRWWISVISSSIKAGWSTLHRGLVPHWSSFNIPSLSNWWVETFGQSFVNTKLKSASKLLITRSLLTCGLYLIFWIIITSDWFYCLIGVAVYKHAFIIVLLMRSSESFFQEWVSIF